MEIATEDKFKHPYCFSLPHAHVVLPVVDLQSFLLATRYV